MSIFLHYGNFKGSVKFSTDEGMFYGSILDIPQKIEYFARSLHKLRQEFIKAVETYVTKEKQKQ